ncbi:MAG: tetratricopeptide repeat protein [Treponema sp.]|nr:tetratricopeptide repeat protein [Treponema sp.]MCL2270827.1 tetratricopeptide repeat protein [Treponema sp.]
MVPVLIAVFVLALGVGLFIILSGKLGGGGIGGGKRSKDREARLKEANKRLAQNPLDPQALNMAGEAYFEEEAWDKAIKTYETLSDLLSRGQAQGIDGFEVFYRYAMSATKLGMTEQAYKGFTSARAIKQNNFEVNYNLGALEFDRKNYEKAVQLLQQAKTMNPESPAVLRYLGHAFFRLKKPKEAMSYIRKAIDLAPDDKESLYTLAECYYEANQTDQALRIFSHLRPDPVMGPSACLITGMIHSDSRKNDLAIQDFEMGLKHQNIKPDTLAELRYYLASVYIKQNEIGKAMPVLKLIQSVNPSYKDVSVLISKYQELNANKNLQTFLMASSADFVALCRKVVMSYYAKAKAKVKVINISVNKNEWADILAEVNTPKWSDLIMFRFIRTQGAIGELIVRDFHSHLKEVKAGKGICITVGAFNEEAKRYTEARMIDLIEKDRLIAILNSVDAKMSK